MELIRRTGKLRPSVEDGIELSGIEMLHPGGHALTQRTAELAGLASPDQASQTTSRRVLDVSSGRGTQSIFYAKEYGWQVTGIDINPLMVSKSKQNAELVGVGHLVQFDQGDSQSLPYANESFDAVINECAVGIPDDPRRVLQEMVRVAKRGARIVIHESTWIKPLSRERKMELAERYGTTPLECDEWKSLLEDAGLNVDTIELTPWSKPEMFWAIRSDRQPRGFSDILTLSERMTTMGQICRQFGCVGVLRAFQNERVFTRAVMSGEIGYGIYSGVKR